MSFLSLIRKQPLIRSDMFDHYWVFAAERQSIFFKRLDGYPKPWTTDSILEKHKFTNAYRASDRVSQFLIRDVIYKGDADPIELFFRIILFKLFNKIETWQMLQQLLGNVEYRTYSFERYDEVLTNALQKGQKIYSAAYIMHPGSSYFGSEKKHRNHLRLIEMMMNDDMPSKIQDAKSMQQIFQLLRSFPTLGDFLAYQYTIDLNYSELINFNEMDFVVPGPGAKSGIQKCFINLFDWDDAEIIEYMTDIQEIEFARLGISFRSLWGRLLQPIDCQNLFCEVDKYLRVSCPALVGIGGRSRIKQLFRENEQPIDYWYPPKWGLNLRTTESR